MRRDDAYLLDMLIAAREVVEMNQGLAFQDVVTNQLRQHATVHLLTVLGEAARKVSTECKSAHPEIPWDEIIGMRNRLVHEYFDVPWDRVWNAVTDGVPAIIPLLEKIIPPEEKPNA